MNDTNFNGIRMKAADWNQLPPAFRKYEDGTMLVLSCGAYRPVVIVDR